MSRIYISQLVGDGTDKNPHRSVAHDHPEHRDYDVLAIPADAQGHPLKQWAVIDLDASDFAPFEADSNLVLLSDKVNLDTVPGSGKRNAVNNWLSAHGSTTTAMAGESFRTIANKLLAELGSQTRL